LTVAALAKRRFDGKVNKEQVVLGGGFEVVWGGGGGFEVVWGGGVEVGWGGG